MTQEIFVDRKVIGTLDNGVFTQRITARGIYRLTNSKGVDVSLYERLKGHCHTWRLYFKDTKQIISIPFDKIEVVGVKENTGAGVQYMVKLEDFNEEQAALQVKMI